MNDNNFICRVCTWKKFNFQRNSSNFNNNEDPKKYLQQFSVGSILFCYQLFVMSFIAIKRLKIIDANILENHQLLA